MINLEQVGAGKNWVLIKSLNEDSLMDRALISSFETTRVKYKIQKFFQGYMNDEKIDFGQNYQYQVLQYKDIHLLNIYF